MEPASVLDQTALETIPWHIQAQTLTEFPSQQLVDQSLDANSQAITKNQKKKANKRKNKLKSAFVKEWLERHTSPAYSKIMALDCQADIQIINYNPNNSSARGNKSQLSDESESQQSSSGDENSDEDFEDYRKDGYHPVHQNEIVDHRYLCLKKLGWGHFSTVWLALKLQEKQLYALKIQKGAQKYTESALEEEQILYDVQQNFKAPLWEKSVRQYYKAPQYEVNRQDTHNVQMYDQFFHHGQNGKHSVMAFEVLGKNLLSLIKKYDYKGIPIKMVREITRQCLMGLDYLHRVCKIIHTDLKPENVVFGITERERFELLCTNVLNTRVVELFETNEPILLSKKQAKNQKKKDRKKKKAQQTAQQQAADDQQDQDDEDQTQPTQAGATEQSQDQNKRSKAQIIIAQMQEKLEQEEQATRANRVYKLKARSKSAPTLTSDLTRGHVMSQKEQDAAGVWIFQHPLRSYRHYVRKYVSNGFEFFKIRHAGDPEGYKEAIKKVTPKTAMRVRSQKPQWRTRVMFNEIKPKSKAEVDKELEMDMNIKLCDMGNACYVEQHYSDVIQTREYRSPEVILEGDYDESADIWSLACLVFELVTGDYLFDPKKGKTFKKNDDHLALVSELIGEPQGDELLWLKENCEAWGDFFEPANRNGTKFKLKRIKSLKMWPIYRVLQQKYRIRDQEAQLLSKFLGRMLRWQPKKRATARDLLDDPWLKVSPLDETHMTKAYWNEWRRANNESVSSSESSESNDDEESLDEDGEEGAESESEPNSGESLEEDMDDEDEVSSHNKTLLDTVPNVTGLNYDPKQTIFTTTQKANSTMRMGEDSDEKQ